MSTNLIVLLTIALLATGLILICMFFLCMFFQGRNETPEEKQADDNAQLEAIRKYNQKHGK